MTNRRVVSLSVAVMVTVSCSRSPSAPTELSFVLVAVDGQALPYQVGVTTTGQPLVVYSGQVYEVARTGQCAFVVKLDPNPPDLSFTNEYVGIQPGPCTLVKGQPKSFTHTFQFRNSTASTARTYTYE